MVKTEKYQILTMAFFIAVLLLVISLYDLKISFLVIGGVAAILLYFFFLTGKINSVSYLYIMIPFIILSPIIPLPGLPAVKLDDLWLAFGALIFLTMLSLKKDKNFTFQLPIFARLYLLFIGWIAISILITSFQSPELYSHRDWLEVYKNVKLLLILLVAVNIKMAVPEKQKSLKIILSSILISAIFGILQFFNVLAINTWLTPYFVSNIDKYGTETLSRVVGTFGNPNIFAAALLVGIALSYSQFFSSYKKRYLVLLTFFFVVMTFTMSRTILIATIVLILFLSLFIFIKSKRKKTFLKSLFFVPLIMIVGLQFAPDRFFFRIGGLDDLSTDSSFQTRLQIWGNIFNDYTRDHILLGMGPASKLNITFDNEWLLILTTYGVVGTFLLLCFFIAMYHRLGKMNSSEINFQNNTVQGLLIVFAGAMISMSVFQQLQLMPLIILVVGIIVSKSGNNNEDTSRVAAIERQQKRNMKNSLIPKNFNKI
ncbi:O-antigen ligase family protein [Planococcus sp. FY231025]|uniref:O-antigen ligase family protein n=1 Tax=Planococcus sp. FY231025 TaxID=3455699 RepID=UPI003F8F85E9